jgi:hypothetical protein
MASHRSKKRVKSVTLSFEVRELFDSRKWEPLILKRHYARRKVSANRVFGLYSGQKLVGCVLFSKPASYTLCESVCGKEFKPHVLELSRLSVPRRSRNAASYLVGRALALLGNHVVVSYADAGVGHIGTVYQATNWLYTGRSSVSYFYHEPTSGKLIAKTRRHIDRKAARLGLTESKLLKVRQPSKHRYVIFTGNRRFKKQAAKSLQYLVLPYPKGKSKRHRLRPVKEAQ